MKGRAIMLRISGSSVLGYGAVVFSMALVSASMAR